VKPGDVVSGPGGVHGVVLGLETMKLPSDPHDRAKGLREVPAARVWVGKTELPPPGEAPAGMHALVALDDCKAPNPPARAAVKAEA
jgi:hypothetical protein